MKAEFPWAGFLSKEVILNIATIGKIGHLTRAPGTLGTIVGLLWYVVFFYPLSPFGWALLLIASTYFACGICDEAEKRMFKRDPSQVILDELVAVPLCFAGLKEHLQPGTWMLAAMLLSGFVLFRLFDILKPFGIRRLQNLPGGVGVVADDIAAAAVTCVLLHITVFLLTHYQLLPQ